jgi:hypothetical protein
MTATDANASSSPKTPLEADLRRLADEIRVRIHLAGMDAKDAWTKLEPRVKEVEQRFARATGEAASELDELGQALRRELDRLHQRLFG